MGLFAEVWTAHFWLRLLTIVWVNTILSGDNAVVIALAARSLPKHQRGKAILWGAGLAVVLLVALTLAAVEVLKLPFLKIAGGVALLYIATKLLAPEQGEDSVESSDNLLRAIWAILIADLVMSTDNVIAVAAAANGSRVLLVVGLAISIPLVIFGATLVMKAMERFPIIIGAGAAILGWVAGALIITDPAMAGLGDLASRLNLGLPAGLGDVSIVQVAGAMFVIGAGKRLAARRRGDESVLELAPEEQRAE